jgi:hypothetical protein
MVEDTLVASGRLSVEERVNPGLPKYPIDTKIVGLNSQRMTWRATLTWLYFTWRQQEVFVETPTINLEGPGVIPWIQYGNTVIFICVMVCFYLFYSIICLNVF